MNFWLWVSFPYLIFGALSLKKSAEGRESPLSSPRKSWGLLDCIVLIALMDLPSVVFKVTPEYLPMLSNSIGRILRNLYSLIVFVIYVRYRFKQPFSALGLHTHSLPTNILCGLQWILPLTLVSTIVEFCYIYFKLPAIEANKNLSVQWLRVEDPWIAFLSGLILLVVLGPLGQELIYRGFFYGPIRYRVSKKMAILLSSAIFYSFHVPPSAHWPPFTTFLLGCLCAYLFEERQSLVPGIIAHGFWNLIVFLRQLSRHNRLPFVPAGHLVEFLSVLLVGQAILFLIVYRLYQQAELRTISGTGEG